MELCGVCSLLGKPWWGTSFLKIKIKIKIKKWGNVERNGVKKGVKIVLRSLETVANKGFLAPLEENQKTGL